MVAALAVFAVTSCHKEPSPQDSDIEYLVYTAPAKDVDFSQFMTFDIADSVLVIGQSDKPYYSKSNNALALVQQYRINMEKRGFIYPPSNPSAQLGVQLTYVEKTERFQLMTLEKLFLKSCTLSTKLLISDLLLFIRNLKVWNNLLTK